MNTNLTNEERESLLKFFLTHCVVKQLDPEGVNYEVKFPNSSSVVTKDIAITITKAMDNLRTQSVPLILKLAKGEL